MWKELPAGGHLAGGRALRLDSAVDVTWGSRAHLTSALLTRVPSRQEWPQGSLRCSAPLSAVGVGSSIPHLRPRVGKITPVDVLEGKLT